jgi:hypothetical protein
MIFYAEEKVDKSIAVQRNCKKIFVTLIKNYPKIDYLFTIAFDLPLSLPQMQNELNAHLLHFD